MLGFALALIGFKLENKNVWEQFKTAPGMHPYRVIVSATYP